MNDSKDSAQAPTSLSDAEVKAKLANTYRPPGTATPATSTTQSPLGSILLAVVGLAALGGILYYFGGPQLALRTSVIVGIGLAAAGLSSWWQGRSESA